MAKEYHVTFSCDTEQDGGKSNILKIQRTMKNGGAELISKNTEWEGLTELVFHYVGSFGEFKKITESAMSEVLNAPSHVSVNAYEHHPKIILEAKSLDNVDALESVLSNVLSENGQEYQLSLDKKSKTITVEIPTSKEAREFSNTITSVLTKNKIVDAYKIEVFPEWEDVTVMEKTNRPASRKSSWTF